MKNIYGEDAMPRLVRAIRHRQAELIEPGTIAGFHIQQQGRYATLNPIVAESEMERHYVWLNNKGVEPVQSEIQHMGEVDAGGHCVALTLVKSRL